MPAQASPWGGILKLDIRRFRPQDESAVVDLWRRCDLGVPWNDPARDIAAKLAFQPETPINPGKRLL